MFTYTYAYILLGLTCRLVKSIEEHAATSVAENPSVCSLIGEVLPMSTSLKLWLWLFDKYPFFAFLNLTSAFASRKSFDHKMVS